ncbi:MAG: pyrroline-5-carboxylate reductase [Pirellulales bacterium]
MLQAHIGFLGAGQMARALAQGFLRAGLVEGRQLAAADPEPAALEAFRGFAPQAALSADNQAVDAKADVLFLAVKPQQMSTALAALAGRIGPDTLVISIAAGVPLKTIAAGLGQTKAGAPRLARVMPNTCCLVGQSASAYCLGPGATEADGRLLGDLLSAVGRAWPVDEKLLDAVTGLSGSGPAYVFLAIEALADGGVQAGLPRATALALAAQTVRGAAEMVLSGGEHPAVLKDRVTSPAGTTIAGLDVLEKAGVRGALMGAVAAAARRSAELSGVS